MKAESLTKASLFLLLSAALVVGYLFLLGVFRGKLGPFSSALPAVVLALFALLLNRQFFRADGQNLTAIGLNRVSLRVRQLAIAFVCGCLLALAWALVLKTSSTISWQLASALNLAAVVGSLMFLVFNNAAEELLYRSYLFVHLSNSYGRTAAVIFSCGLFTIMHIQGGVPWPNALAGVFTSALVFAAIFIRWQSMPIVLSFHFATNFMQELLGLRVTGLSAWSLAHVEELTSPQIDEVLLVTAAINILLAITIFYSIRRSRPTAHADALERV